MSGKLGIGIVGCGNISTTYLRLAPLFATPVLQFRLGAVGHLVGYTLVAVSVAVVCRGNVGLFGVVERGFRRLPGPFFLRPVLGALGTGVVALLLIYSLWWSDLWPSRGMSRSA